MYIPPEFNITDEQTINRFIHENAFGILNTNIDGYMEAAHLPFLMELENGKRVFYVHVANENPLAKMSDGQNCLLIFSGAHGYISSSWYSHTNVSTWNYQAAHVYGKAEKVSDEMLLLSLEKLTRLYEEKVGGHVFTETLPPRLISGYMQHITGFKITEEHTEVAFKLSQNRKKEDYIRILEKVAGTNPALADEMEKHSPY